MWTALQELGGRVSAVCLLRASLIRVPTLHAEYKPEFALELPEKSSVAH
jgi:hypothetical protein